MFSILQMIASSTVTHSIVTAYVLRPEITNIFKNLQKIYEQGNQQKNINLFMLFLFTWTHF